MKHFTALLIFASLVSFACKETVTSTSGSGTPGDITGYVVVYDTNYQTMPDKSGVKVSLAGTPYSVLTDASGNWQLSNVPSGTYIVDVTKDHYAETKHFNFVYGGNGTYYWGYTATMYPIPNIFPVIVLRPFEDKIQITERDSFVYLKNDSLRDSIRYLARFYDTTIFKSEIAIFSSHTVSQYNKQGVACILFLGKNSSIDPAVPSSYLLTLTASPDTSGISNFTLLRSSLLSAGFASNDQIYAVVYATAVPSGTILGYNDLVTRKFIYSDLSPHPSEVKPFLLP